MPSITDATVQITKFPNRFVSPFGNDDLIPMYSSQPVLSVPGGCLECAVCGNTTVRHQVVDANSLLGAKLDSSVQIALT